MSNVLKVTTPTVERGNLNPVRPESGMHPQDMKIQNPVSTERVVRPDVRNDAAPGSRDQDVRLNYESNFNAFVKGLGKNPELGGILSRFLQMGSSVQAESGIGADTAAEIARLLEMVQTGTSGIGGLMKNQVDAANRFQGPFFDLLRQVMAENDSMPLQQEILRFLKRYVDTTSAGHLQERLKNILEQAQERMMKSAAQTLSEKGKGLFESSGGQIHVREDVSRLKHDILPFLNSYISATHDRGGLRELTAGLTLLLSRYENADRAGLIQSFLKLKDYAAFQKYFGGVDEKQFDAFLTRMEEMQTKSLEENGKLADILKNAMTGAGGTEMKQLAENVLHSMLLNESVYMPLLHMMFPLNVDGRLLYSEMWVDPDAARPQGEENIQGRAVRALIKFDIQDVGFFDLFLYYFDGKADIQLNYPTAFREKEREIRENVRRIMDERGITCKTIVLEGTEGSIPLSEAFPEIYERKNTINVRV